jgi:hypothetical protein
VSGLNPRQLRDFVVRPALAALGLPGGEPAERLVMGTGAQESAGFQYIHQLGKGPALSLWQIEPETAKDAMDRVSGDLFRRLIRYGPGTISVLECLPGNLYLGASLCRLVYYLKPFRLEALGNGEPEALARVWKRYYNSPAGAGTEAQFLVNWDRYCREVYA